MKVRTNLSVLVITAALLAPVAYGADSSPDAVSAEQSSGAVTTEDDAVPQDQLQNPEKDEAFDIGLPARWTRLWLI
jgi:hypothetical protein